MTESEQNCRKEEASSANPKLEQRTSREDVFFDVRHRGCMLNTVTRLLRRQCPQQLPLERPRGQG